MTRILILATVLVSLEIWCENRSQAQVVNWEAEPICYSETPATRNPVARLQHAIESDDVHVEGDDPLARLRWLLEQLQVPSSSQVMVFSKTSLQKPEVSPDTPRAIYFNDDVFVGYVQNGLIEIATADPDLGTVFYTLDPHDEEPPQLLRQANRCLGCHGGARTAGIPGFQVRSVFPDTEGKPVLRAGSSLSNHRSPIAERWGGWYVTGTHGSQHHRGGYLLDGNRRPAKLINDEGENQLALPSSVDVTAYLEVTSDITALMVMEHQVEAYNLLTQANFVTQHALWQADGEALDPAQRQRISKAIEPLAEYLCFRDEVPLIAPIGGVGNYTSDFSRVGHANSPRILRQFELRTRLFQYPLSYLVASETFTNLNPVLQSAIATAIWDRIDETSGLADLISQSGPRWLTENR
ncbi:hypothetical protein [Allorhodopirellula solitaria]|uniref:Cytochrome c domain-containing protein n=1 Tax=Allorhodopirellula solitaria TaxID=2527987 RepID=A0A5C5YK30_9BACT|nr:hypothetical protein [Allorhodopirellula solitaria]TWT75265.1 hypothetical protein CA85_05540 [Allorhodopirellula solitaria]